MRSIGLFLAALLASGSAFAAGSWDSYISQQLSPATVAKKSAAGASAGKVDRRARNITMALLEAHKHWNELSPATRALAQRWMARPDVGGGDDLGGGVIVSINPAHETSETTTHFRLHYVNCASYPSDTNCARASYISAVKAELEVVYDYEIATRGYSVPPSDGTAGGDARYDVYVAELGQYDIYGYANPEDYPAPVSQSYLVIDNDYAGFGYSDPVVPMKVTLAHEYFHAVQMGYDATENTAFMENSSTWMESMAYPTLHDNYQYLGEPYADENANGRYDRGELFTDRDGDGIRSEGSMDYPHYPLDSTNATFEYGRWLWPQYLTEKHSANLMRDIWDAAKATPGDNHFAAMNQALVAVGSSLAAAYQEYAAWAYDSLQYADGANYPRARVAGVVNGSANLSSTTDPDHMATVYVRINNPNGSYSFNSSGASAALTMLEVASDCSITSTPVVLDPMGDGTWTPGATTAIAVAAISNVSTATENLNWSLTGGTADDSVVPVCAITVKNGTRDGGTDSGGGTGALDLLALSLAGLLYARRRLR